MEKDPKKVKKNREIILTNAQIARVREAGHLTFPPLRTKKHRYRCKQLSELGSFSQKHIEKIRSQVSWPGPYHE